jgi:hypothetical protein
MSDATIERQTRGQSQGLPRGIGTLLAMFVVGRLMRKLDVRWPTQLAAINSTCIGAAKSRRFQGIPERMGAPTKRAARLRHSGRALH